MKVNYFTSVQPGKEIEAEASIIHNGSTLVTGVAEVKNGLGKRVAFGTATFIC